MTTRQRMRRQARLARRAGMQPMMVINSGDTFPESAGVLLLRQAWRYRSELAPAYLALALGVASAYAHASFPRWWALVLALSAMVAGAVAAFGARAGLTAPAERLYAATVALAAGAWLTAATALGPFAKPLPVILGVGAVVLAVPWWAHRRRRMRVRVERQLAAWPEIAKAIGLAGSQVMSATVDPWGWRARFRLARGQTIAEVTAKVPAIESGLGTFRGAIRVYPTPEDLANQCEVRVLNTDPHADAIPWPGPSAASITQPVEIGPFEDAAPCRVTFLRRHALFAGTTGAGKSGGLNVLMGNLTACRDVVIWAIDLKKGMELRPWESCIDRLATTPEQAAALLRDASAIVRGRAEALAAAGRRTWEPSPDAPALVIVIDEYAELAEQAPEVMRDTDSVSRLGRAVAVTLIAATQRPTQKAMGAGAVRSQMDLRVCFRVRERRDVDLVLGQGMLSAGWNAHKLNAPGKFLISSPEHDTPKRARAYLLTDAVVAATAAEHECNRPLLDDLSRQAVIDAPARRTAAPDTPGETGQDDASPANVLWRALCAAPEEGWDTAQLMRITGLARTTFYRHLRDYATAGRACEVSRGRWRARTTDEQSP
jgi:S-DNA-T family DNA segregation ATPase FtsK/SpoIIIE